MNSQQKSISVIIPAYNDHDTIKKVVLSVDKFARRLTKRYEIIAIDDGSQDKTWLVLQDIKKNIEKLKCWRHNTNQGHGKTLKELYLAAKNEIIFSLPGNGQIQAKKLLKLIPYIDRYDMIIGKRRLRQISLLRKAQSKFYNLLINLLYGLNLSDVNSVRILKRSCLQEVKLITQTSFIDAELCYKFIKNGYKIIEVPIEHTPGVSRGGGTLKVIIPTIIEALKFWFKKN